MIDCVKFLGTSFGGINLEDFKAPDCFIIEKKLKEIMDIPIFHDDQHGTAIVCLAGLINAVKIADKKIEDVKVVLNGAGAAGMACIRLMNVYGVKKENTIVCDSKGVIYKGRTVGMNEYKEEFAAETDKRTLAKALVNADVFVGVSAAGTLKPEYLETMASTPIIFAMANPEPEIRPNVAKAIRPTPSRPPEGWTTLTRSTTSCASPSCSAQLSIPGPRRSTRR